MINCTQFCQTLNEGVTYRVHTLLLQLGFFQIVAFLSYTESFPALADFFVDLGLGHILGSKLHDLMNIEVVQQVGRPETKSNPHTQLTRDREIVKVHSVFGHGLKRTLPWFLRSLNTVLLSFASFLF